MQQKLMKVYEKELKEEAKKQKEVRHSHSQTHHGRMAYFFLDVWLKANLELRMSSNILLPYGLKLGSLSSKLCFLLPFSCYLNVL